MSNLVVAAVAAAEPDPLFAADDIITVSIAAPFQEIMVARPDEDYIEGTFSFVDGDGVAHELSIGLQTRGAFRRRRNICPFAPLRINFRKGQLDDTVFDGQDKLKMVTHCRNGSEAYKQAVLSEYIAYRIFNIMTDRSFRVRLLHVNYVYTDKNDRATEAYAFLIEDKGRLAKRIGSKELDLESIKADELQPDHGNLASVFQYLVGNSDFSPVSGRAGETCCHNHALFGGDEPPYLSIPYDFDQTGIVDAPHASPNPRFHLRSVRERIYRGRCINAAILPATLERFRARRGDIESLIRNQAGLSKRTRTYTLKYVDSFYKVINDEKSVDRYLVKECI